MKEYIDKYGMPSLGGDITYYDDGNAQVILHDFVYNEDLDTLDLPFDIINNYDIETVLFRMDLHGFSINDNHYQIGLEGLTSVRDYYKTILFGEVGHEHISIKFSKKLTPILSIHFNGEMYITKGDERIYSNANRKKYSTNLVDRYELFYGDEIDQLPSLIATNHSYIDPGEYKLYYYLSKTEINGEVAYIPHLRLVQTIDDGVPYLGV